MRLILLLMVSTLLYSDIQDHFRKALNKSAAYSFKNIDFIYLINLDERPEKLKLSLDQLTHFQIYPYRFPAINGWELSLDTINDVGLIYSPEMNGGFLGTCYNLDENFEPCHEIIENYGQTYYSHCMARGPIGIALSHISVLQDAYDSGYETIWVMEDDIEVIQDPRILPNLIEQLNALVGLENWDILFTDRDMRDMQGNYNPCYWGSRRPDFTPLAAENNYSLRSNINEDFIKIGARYGAHSMIIRRSGIRKLLQFFKAHQLFLPFDLELVLPSGINLYTVAEDIVSNLPMALSDNGGPNYLNKKKNP